MASKFTVSKRSKVLILILAAAVVVIGGCWACDQIIYHNQIAGINTDASYCKNMAPLEVTASQNTYRYFGQADSDLDFADKSVLSHGKFGYWHKLQLKQKTVVTMRAAENRYMIPTYFYGIYRDKKLDDPVVQVDESHNIKAWTAREEGGDEELAASYHFGIRAVLEPGTYYAAIYTTDPKEESVVNYESWYAQ